VTSDHEFLPDSIADLVQPARAQASSVAGLGDPA